MAAVSLFIKRFLPGSGFCGQSDIVSSPAMFPTREWQVAVEDGRWTSSCELVDQPTGGGRPANQFKK
tara:strand:+ start:87 stop:287 length:201 start_codon:yes stop_codon:yes gene_type:complete